jgi:hypothetical protein
LQIADGGAASQPGGHQKEEFLFSLSLADKIGGC